MSKSNETKKKDNYYRLLAESSRDIIMTHDLRGKIIYVNPAWTEISGYSAEETQGESVEKFLFPKLREDMEQRYKQRKMGQKDAYTYEIQIISKTKEKIPIGMRSTPVITDQEDFDEILLVGHDLRQRKKNEATLKRQLNELNILQATAYASTQSVSRKDLIRQITNIIGNTLYPDNFGILLLDKDTQMLQPHPSYQGVSIEQVFMPIPLSKGITGKVATTRKALCVKNVAKSSEYIEFNSSSRSELCVPLKVGEEILGVINAESSKLNFFDTNDERLLLTIAGQTATALEKIRLLETEKKRRRFAEKLQESSTVLTTVLDKEKAISLILKELSDVVSFDSASVQLLSGNYLKIVGGRGDLVLIKEKDRRIPYPGDNPNTEVIQTKLPVILDNAPKAYSTFLEVPSIQSWMGVPLIVQDKTIGVLALDSGKVNHFTQKDARLVMSFASHAAIAIQNATFFDAEKKLRKESDILRETALAVTASLNIDEAVQRILEQLSRVLDYDSASVQVLDADSLKIIAGRGWLNPGEVKGMRFFLNDTNPNTRVIREKEILILNDAQEEHAPFRLPPHNHIRAWMGVPLVVREKVVGMLTIDSKEKGCFTDEGARIVQAFAHQAAIAIENARLFDAEQGRRQEAETLRQSAHTISSSLNLEEVLNTILASIKRAIPYDSAAIMLLEGDVIRLTAGHGLPNIENQLGKTFSTKNFFLAKLIKDAHPIILADAQKNTRFSKWAGTDYVRGWMSIPLIVRSKVIGHITLDSYKVNAYTEKDAELAQTFAHQAASAIDNARLYERALEAADKRIVLHRLSQDILRVERSGEETYEAIYHAAEKLMPCEAFVILLRGEDGKKDKAVFLVDKGKEYEAREVSRGNSIIFLTEKAKGSFIDRDLSTESLRVQKTHFGSQKKVRSRLISPMYVGEKLIGAISAQSYNANAYSDEEKTLLEMLASYAASAIENIRLFNETTQRGKEFTEIYRITQDLVTPQELDTLLNTTLERAALLLGVTCADIYLYNSKTERLTPASTYGLSRDCTKKVMVTSLAIGEGVAGRVAERLKALRIDNYHTWKKKSAQFEEHNNTTSILGIPMLYAGNLIGVMTFYEIHPNTHLFTEADQRVMSLFATQVAGAVHSAKQFEELNNRLAELEAINRISTALRSAKTQKELLSVLLTEIRKSFNIDVYSVWLNDSATEEVYRAISHGWISEIKPTRQKNDTGLIGHVYQSEKTYTTSSLKKDHHIQEKDRFLDGWTGIWVPIRSTGTTLGVIAIMAEEPRQFNKNDVRLLSTLAEISGSAIQRSHLSKHKEEQVKHLSALRNIDTAISANFDLNITLQLLVNHTVSLLGASAVSVLLLEPPSQNLKYFIGKGFHANTFSNTLLESEKGLPRNAIEKRRLQYTKSPHENETCARSSWFLAENFSSYYCVPLVAKGETLGVLEVFHREKLAMPSEKEVFLQTLAGQAAIAINNHYLLKNLKQSKKELSRAYDLTLEGWGKALGLRDEDTQEHTINVTELSLQLAREVGMAEEELEHVNRGALLHDIGKMGIPDNILRKRGPLTKGEWAIMRQHPQFAYDMISEIPYLLPALDIPYCHHERWDGNGYPRGLKGKEIPLAARVFSIIDTWDALLTNRSYRDAWEKKTVMDYIRNESGTRFDPEIVEVFIKMVEHE